MAFFKDTDKFLKWRYHIDEIIILYSKKKEEKIGTEKLKSLSIMHDYETNLFPIFKIELVMESSIYYDILKDKKDVKIKLRLQKYSTEIGSNDKSLYKDYINRTFDLILDDTDYDADESFRSEAKNNDLNNVTQDNRNQMDQSNNLIELFLFDSALVDKFNVNVNEILTNANPLTGIQYVTSAAGIGKILMTPPDNTKSTAEMVIPFMKAKEGIRWVDTYYGLYKTGMMLYSDFISGITYILKYSGECTAWQKKEIKETDILIPEKSSKYSSDLCSVQKKGEKDINYVVGDNSNISIRNETVSHNAITGIESSTFDPESGDLSSSSSPDDATKTKSSVFIENKTENPYYSNLYTSFTTGKHVIIETTLGDYDIDAIAPNKKFKLIFEDTKMASKYKNNFLITGVVHNFIKEGADFTLSSIIKLKEVK